MVLENLSPVDPQALYVQHVFFFPTEPSQMVLKTFIFDNSSHSPLSKNDLDKGMFYPHLLLAVKH